MKLNMEKGDGSGHEHPKVASNSNSSRTPTSSLALSAASKIVKRGRGRSKKPGSKFTIHDNTSQGYGWLLPGWLAEERHMESGRIYRYYYDPSGRMYRSQHEVIYAWEELGMVVIDK